MQLILRAVDEPLYERPPLKKNLSILCVDDTIYNIFVLKEMLKQIDPKMNIDSAMNG